MPGLVQRNTAMYISNYAEDGDVDHEALRAIVASIPTAQHTVRPGRDHHKFFTDSTAHDFADFFARDGGEIAGSTVGGAPPSVAA